MYANSEGCKLNISIDAKVACIVSVFCIGYTQTHAFIGGSQIKLLTILANFCGVVDSTAAFLYRY